jgi:purine-cytosine permease-like protein
MMQLLDFVALYGLILMPMGVVIFADFWLLPRMGLQSHYAELCGLRFSWPAALTWTGTLVVCAFLPMEIFFLGLPGWFIAVGLYVLFCYIQQQRKPGRIVQEVM